MHHHHLPGHHRTGPPLLFAAAVLVALAVVTPLVFLVVQAFQTGWSTLQPLLFRSLTAQLLWNTVSLTVVVTALCAVVGTALAWFVERTDLPGRRMWAVLVVVPLGIPDFVVSFGWRAIFPAFGGFWAAVMVMTLAVYPLVFLPVAANMRNADTAQEEVARSLGLGRLSTFWKVTVGQARLAILGGSVLVALVCLAEFGAFEILGFRTLTTEAFTEFTVGFNTAAGCAFSLILVLLGVMLLAGEGFARGKGRAARVGSGAARVLRPRPLGRGTLPALAGVAAVVVLALGVPVGAIVWLIVEGGTSTVPNASIWGATLTTFGYAAGAGLVATIAALPVGLLSVRFPGRRIVALERTSMLILAVPGIVIALSATYVTEHLLAGPLVPDHPSAHRRLRRHVLSDGRGLGARRRGPGAGGARGGGELARRQPAFGLLPGDVAADRAGPGRRLLPRLPRDGDRAHGHAHPHPDGRADPGHRVLGSGDQPELRGGRALRRAHGDHRGGAQLRARPLVRPAPGPHRHGRRRAACRHGDVRGAPSGHNWAMKQLVVRGACKSFGDHTVLDGVDLTVPSGSFTGILGVSGSGKTTLLRIVAGFERLDRGEVQLGSEVVDDGRHVFVPCEHRRIGYVPQEGALFPHLSVGRNIAFGLRRGPKRRERVMELLAMVGLTGLGRRYPHQLSGGQQQRVALARALATDPEIVLLDEPFSSLDASLRASVRAEVHDVLRQTGATSILVTHDQDEALSMADQVAVLRHGVIAQLGTPADIYQRPLDPALARFLGESNVLHAAVGAAASGPAGSLAADTPLGVLPVEGWPEPATERPGERVVGPRDDPARTAPPRRRRPSLRWRRWSRATSTTGTTRWSGSGPRSTSCPSWWSGSRGARP